MYDWSFGSSDVEYADLSSLEDYADTFDGDRLKGLIFHVSRCGSTALANAFRPVNRTLVISESGVLTRLVRVDNLNKLVIPSSRRACLARGFLGAVLKEHPGRNIVIKFPSLVSSNIAAVREMFPDIRWCFSSRRPSDIFTSLKRAPSGWLRSLMSDRLRSAEAASHRGDHVNIRERCAPLLTTYFRNAIANADKYASFLDYEDFGQQSVSAIVYSFLNLEPDAAYDAAIHNSLASYSKSLEKKPFVPEPSTGMGVTGIRELDEAYDDYRSFIRHFAERHIGAPGVC
jgi:hypothetical protein